MSTAELILRIVGVCAGTVLAVAGAVLAHHGRGDDKGPAGCLSLALVLGGLLVIAFSFPAWRIFE